MRLIAIRTQTERKRQDRSVRPAEKRRCRAGTLRVHGPIRPTSGVCAITDAAWGEKHLFNWQNQAILASDGRPLGECRFELFAAKNVKRWAIEYLSMIAPNIVQNEQKKGYYYFKKIEPYLPHTK